MPSIVIASDHADFALKKELAPAFLKAGFSGYERHVRRLNKVREQEKNFGVPEGEAS